MSGMNYQIADQIVDVGDLLKWVGHTRAEIAALRARAEAADQRAEAAEAEVARWRAPHGEIDMLLPDVERVLLVAELGARLTPDIAADWMPRARSALAALRARDIGASAALEGAQRRYLESEAEVARLRAALGTDR